MFKILFTTDYEIHGNGEGSPWELMIEPTYRNLDLFDEYGAKLTIMADVAEILKFKQYKEENGKDSFYFDELVLQLKEAVKRGHDVQLHLHPDYFAANYIDNKWNFDSSNYQLQTATYHELFQMIQQGKDFLCDTLKEVKNNYDCIAFRAGGWQMQPTKNIVNALVDNGFLIDTSVFKNGKRDYKFDYASAHHAILPWIVDENDVCRYSENGKLIEIPIYTVQRFLHSFFSINRFYRVANQKKNCSPINRSTHTTLLSKAAKFLKKNPLKMDFNQCTGRQLVKELKEAYAKYSHIKYDIPFVIIGHSKTFTKYNERSLRPFLEFVQKKPDNYQFTIFPDLNTNSFRYLWKPDAHNSI